jgi:hypothetical protein
MFSLPSICLADCSTTALWTSGLLSHLTTSIVESVEQLAEHEISLPMSQLVDAQLNWRISDDIAEAVAALPAPSVLAQYLLKIGSLSCEYTVSFIPFGFRDLKRGAALMYTESLRKEIKLEIKRLEASRLPGFRKLEKP